MVRSLAMAHGEDQERLKRMLVEHAEARGWKMIVLGSVGSSANRGSGSEGEGEPPPGRFRICLRSLRSVKVSKRCLPKSNWNFQLEKKSRRDLILMSRPEPRLLGLGPR